MENPPYIYTISNFHTRKTRTKTHLNAQAEKRFIQPIP